ncbi:hypothetical protein QUF90_05180 [Desulfococcaceae bacterium HSG9]|nr:hypothetical protein [Desulfococcaceae bacterium HSG9]
MAEGSDEKMLLTAFIEEFLFFMFLVWPSMFQVIMSLLQDKEHSAITPFDIIYAVITVLFVIAVTFGFLVLIFVTWSAKVARFCERHHLTETWLITWCGQIVHYYKEADFTKKIILNCLIIPFMLLLLYISTIFWADGRWPWFFAVFILTLYPLIRYLEDNYFPIKIRTVCLIVPLILIFLYISIISLIEGWWPALFAVFISELIPIFYFIAKKNYRIRKSGKFSAWKKFASDENLTLARRRFFIRGSCYRGVYRHHLLILEPFQAKLVNEKSYFRTRIRIAMDRVANSSDRYAELPSAEKAMNMLTPESPQYILREASFQNLNADTIKQKIYLYYEQGYIERSGRSMKRCANLIVDMANTYSTLALSGGKAVPFLKEMIENEADKSVAAELIKDISRKTTVRLKGRLSTALCAFCYTRCKQYKTLSESFELLPYHGCRICRQSSKILEGIVQVVAILDNRNEDEHFEQDGTLRVNWLKRRASFDFDEVEIIRAGDEDVERFAVQVGNDNDSVRRPLYKKMRCTVASDCELTENTLRVLRNMFGKV